MGLSQSNHLANIHIFNFTTCMSSLRRSHDKLSPTFTALSASPGIGYIVKKFSLGQICSGSFSILIILLWSQNPNSLYFPHTVCETCYMICITLLWLGVKSLTWVFRAQRESPLVGHSTIIWITPHRDGCVSFHSHLISAYAHAEVNDA